MMISRRCTSLVLLFFLFSLSLSAQPSRFEGTWKLVPEKSSEIGLYGTLALDILVDNGQMTLVHTWGSGRALRDTLTVKTGGGVQNVPVKNRVWPTNVFMGLALEPGQTKQVTAAWEKDSLTLKVEERYTLLASQGQIPIYSVNAYKVSDDGQTLTLKMHRSSRTKGPDPVYVFRRSDAHPAFFMRLADNWEINGKLPTHAFLISLQGLANSDEARLYFIYPEKWDFLFTQPVFDFYSRKKNYTFRELKSPEEAFEQFKYFAKGYVVWDTSVRTSLIVAYTIAGLERAVVVTEEMIPMMEKAGLRMVQDLRGLFAGKKDVEIYQWAYDRYWDRCNRDFIVWLGGEAGKIMKPGIADFGIVKRAFFTDLSTERVDSAEYALADRIMGEMHPMGLVMGWHSYAKDKERDYVSLASHHVLRVEGLHTLPNVSFSSHVALDPGFTFKNNHNLVPGKKYDPAKKVYITCVQTDGLGLGAEMKQGRGDIPYAWEVTMNWVWLMPSMLEFFYDRATPNDFFIGCLSGPGYMYPKAIPREALPGVVAKAWELMQQLDLNVFEIMDYSQGATVEGNTELTKAVVDAYYAGMPGAIGFINGYAPAYTFTVRDGRPLMSYDYYLSETRPETEAVADLQELAAINAKRPYFLLMHVREYSDIIRVKGILSKLGSEFEVVPLDVFLKLAGKQPTFEERFLAQ